MIEGEEVISWDRSNLRCDELPEIPADSNSKKGRSHSGLLSVSLQSMALTFPCINTRARLLNRMDDQKSGSFWAEQNYGVGRGGKSREMEMDLVIAVA
mmetsp:Transcript_8540/g.28576  ORF Transcript_8540/g.28576 Transcript_8540/m.28576 type:complete len:98 (+) Transcript_8540:250-543(+)